MITFNEFLVQFNGEVQDVYIDAEMSKNAFSAVVSVMREYLGNSKFDPMELLALFESVCYSAMGKEVSQLDSLRTRVANDARVYLTENGIVEERRTRGR